MPWQSIGVLSVTVLAALSDLRNGKVPNSLTYPAAAIALTMQATLPTGDVAVGLRGMLGSFFLFLLLNIFAGLGAGDVKLMAVVGALKGLSFSLYSTFYILSAGCALGVAVLAWRGQLGSCLRSVGLLITGRFSAGGSGNSRTSAFHTMPFAPAIFLGVAWTVWLEYAHGPIMLRAF